MQLICVFNRVVQRWKARVLPAVLLAFVSALVGTIALQSYSTAVHGVQHAAQDLGQSLSATPSLASPDCPLCVASHSPAQTPQSPVGVHRLTQSVGRVVAVDARRAANPIHRPHSARAPPFSLPQFFA